MEGGEYNSKAFKNFYDNNEIILEVVDMFGIVYKRRKR